MTLTLILAALAMGFFGSPHCLGMCGGIVAAFGISMKNLSSTKRTTLIATYHLGRIFSYMGLGLIASLFGSQVIAPFLTDNALPRLLLGLALVFVAFMMLGVPFMNRLEKIGLGLWQRLAPIRQKVLPINTLPKALGAGLLWGLLPCGLVYGALGLAVSVSATGQEMFGVVVMGLFGIGTLPMLLATDGMIAFLQKTIKQFNLRKFSGAIMLVSGLAVAFSPSIMHYFHSHSPTEHGNSHNHQGSPAHHHDHSLHSNHQNHAHHEHSHHNH